MIVESGSSPSWIFCKRVSPSIRGMLMSLTTMSTAPPPLPSISSASAPSRANRKRTWPSRIWRRNFCWTRASRSGSSSTSRIVEVMPLPPLLGDNIERLVDDVLAETDLRVLTSRHRLACRALLKLDDSRRCGGKEAWIDGAKEFGIRDGHRLALHSGDRPGHHQHPRNPVRRGGAGAQHRANRADPATSAPRLGRARPGGDLAKRRRGLP